MKQISGSNSEVPALSRGLDIIARIAGAREGLGFAELLETTRIPKASLFRILAFLESQNYLRKDRASSRFFLGSALLTLAGSSAGMDPVVTMTRPVLGDLSAEFKETAELALPENGSLYLADRAECSESIRLAAPVGFRIPESQLGFVGHGIVYLACTENKKLGDKTKAAITLVKNLGFAAEIGIWREDVFRIAAPVRRADGSLAASIAIAGPVYRLDAVKTKRMGIRIAETAKKLSRRLGWDTKRKERII